MGKNSPSHVLDTILKDILNIKNVIRESKEIKKLCNNLNFNDKNEVERILENTKTIVATLKDEVEKINSYFDENYEILKNNLVKLDSSSVSTNGNDEIVERGGNDEIVERGEELEESAKEAVESPVSTVINAMVQENKEKKESESNKVNEVQEEKQIAEPEKENVNISDETTNIAVENPQPQEERKVFLKCVDINKLINPDVLPLLKSQDSNKNALSDSILIISDSESEKEAQRKSKKSARKSKNKTVQSQDVKLKTYSKRRKAKKEIDISSSDSEVIAKKRPKRNCKIMESLHIDLSTSDSDDSVSKQSVTSQTKNKTIEDDVKLKLKATVPLQRIACEKLKEYYLNKKETKEINRLLNIDYLEKDLHKKNSKKNGSSKTNKNKASKSKEDRKSAESSTSSSKHSSMNDLVSIIDTGNDEAPKIVEESDIMQILDGINSEMDTSSEEKNKDSSDKEDDTDEGKKQSKDSQRAKKKSSKCKNTSSDSDSEDECTDSDKDTKSRKMKKKQKKKVISSDSDSDSKNKKKNSSSSETSSNSSSTSSSEEDKKKKEDTNAKKTMRRIKRVESSSDEDQKTRKSIRKVIARDSLAETTKQAEKDERERKARILERQKKYNKIFEGDEPIDASVEKVVLDFNEETKEEILSVHKDLVKKLKPHQAKGVQFMWDACFESLERAKSTKGSGCILAHCMGLGKTLQVIALIHTLVMNEEKTGVSTVLVVCPVGTVLNWVAEFKKWLNDIPGLEIDIYELVSHKQISEREYKVEHWHNQGGVLVVGYDMFRNLTNFNNKRIRKKTREIFIKGLTNPGPDLVICDEGHLLKNEKTNISIAMNKIQSERRIVLTGTPMQNNLKEYYCMVQFVKPNLLGTYKEYLNRFVNPITNGQYTDSTPHDIHIMRKRSHVLHKLLDGIVQRQDYSVLTPFLPPKYEYVLFLTLGEVQINLYQHYKDHYSQNPVNSKVKSTFLFMDFQELQRICTHPRVLLDKSEERKRKAIFEESDESEGSLKDFIDDESEESSSSSSSSSNSDSSKSKSDESIKSDQKKKRSSKRLTRNVAAAEGIDIEEINKNENVETEWWRQYCDGDELDNINHSSKLFLLFEILQECELIGDKLLVFSQSLYSLSIIEYFLARIDEATQKGENDKVSGFSGSWALGLDYFRLDGSSSCDNRSAWCNSFNDPDNTRARLFLISTRAGGLGINLIGANRVIIFDVSWNPSHDIQSIYRVYRFGQLKPCYIYRFVIWGTMEMKIYERQVTKQAISKRVIDEQQIDRHYNQNDLAELYSFEPKPTDHVIPLIPKDVLLAELLQKEKDRIYKYHEHQSLLENKEDEELNEDERKVAWEEFENEKTARAANTNTATGWIKYLPLNVISDALLRIVQKDNPSWTYDQVKSVIPTVIQQLREQVNAGDLQLYTRIVNEIKLTQMSHQHRYQEYLQQRQVQMLQQRLQNPRFPIPMNNNFTNSIQAMYNHRVNQNAMEVVELND